MIKDALKQFFIYGAGSSAQAALGFVLLPLYLRFFEPSEYGIISLFMVTVSLLTVFASAGMVSALHRLYFEAKEEDRKRLAFTTWFWYLLMGGLFGLIIFVNAVPISQHIFSRVELAYPIGLLGIYLFIFLLREVPLNLFRLEKKAGHYVGFSLAGFAIDFGLKLYFIAFLERGIAGYFESGIIAWTIILFSMLPFTLKYVNLSLSRGYLKELLRLGSPFILSGIAVWVLQVSDRYILEFFRGEAAVGIYHVGYTFANLFNVFMFSPSGLFWSPFFFSYAAERSTKETKRLLNRSLVYFFLAGGVLYLLISLGCADVLRIFTFLFATREGYWQAATLVPLLALGPFLYLLCRQASSALLMAKKPEFTAIALAIAAGFNLGLNFIFIPKFGALGAAITTALAYALSLGLCYWWAGRIWPVKHEWKRLAKGFLFLAIAFIIGWMITISQPWASLFARVIAGVVVFALLSWFVSNLLNRDEKRKFLTYLTDWRRRLVAVLLRRS
jgi:O-antigen/teichoic acid export membrane protein